MRDWVTFAILDFCLLVSGRANELDQQKPCPSLQTDEKTENRERTLEYADPCVAHSSTNTHSQNLHINAADEGEMGLRNVLDMARIRRRSVQWARSVRWNSNWVEGAFLFFPLGCSEWIVCSEWVPDWQRRVDGGPRCSRQLVHVLT